MTVIEHNEIVDLLQHLQPTIDDDYRVEGQEDDDDTPTMQVTIASDGNPDEKEWAYQTGDNSYSGACYFYRFWAVIYLTQDEDLDLDDIARDAIDQIENQIATAI